MVEELVLVSASSYEVQANVQVRITFRWDGSQGWLEGEVGDDPGLENRVFETVQCGKFQKGVRAPFPANLGGPTQLLHGPSIAIHGHTFLVASIPQEHHTPAPVVTHDSTTCPDSEYPRPLYLNSTNPRGAGGRIRTSELVENGT